MLAIGCWLLLYLILNVEVPDEGYLHGAVGPLDVAPQLHELLVGVSSIVNRINIMTSQVHEEITNLEKIQCNENRGCACK
jgi:hypothetical protein